ncbi:MAG TPA: indolepyruvate ferredoxin oxidoreductase subunit alpha [Coriobacteriia bacterium]|nr:indolepyruvate ferredoxin oxidoreductase subunit alpha [Coriobacteriia bacterium]
MARTLMSGNEAVARGAWEAGVRVGVGYPGTPSTEVLENLVRYQDVHCEWAPNEKVAAEVAGGVSLGGARTLVTMKHVGLNVAADALYTQAYTGVTGGLVYLVADDPGMHSSQNEQDTRNHAAAAHVPLLEPSDSTEAREFVKRAFEISETYDIPVIVRMTTRVSHGKSLVEAGERVTSAVKPYASQPPKYVMMPGNARVRRIDLESRLTLLAAFAESAPENRMEMRDTTLGIVTSGIAYQYVREALPDASVLKLGIINPLPENLVLEFSSRVDRIAVVEELDPYLTVRLRALGIELVETGLLPMGELSPVTISRAFGGAAPAVRERIPDLPPRPPLLCPGCPHRGVFHGLAKMRAIVIGDIGCYTLAALPPLKAMDSCVCMGASIGMAHGLELAGSAERPVVAVIGDSTFAHSGLTGLLHMAYAGGAGTVVVLDNRTTAMTGHQGNPVSGIACDGSPAPAVDLEALCTALGAASVRTVDPHDLAGTLAVLKEETAAGHLSVIIAKAPCALIVKEQQDPFAVDEELCTKCGACIRLGCPAISADADGRAVIDTAICVGCGQCVQVCRFDAIVQVGPSCDIGGV